jgi:hypothetical protein
MTRWREWGKERLPKREHEEGFSLKQITEKLVMCSIQRNFGMIPNVILGRTRGSSGKLLFWHP